MKPQETTCLTFSLVMMEQHAKQSVNIHMGNKGDTPILPYSTKPTIRHKESANYRSCVH